MKGWIMVGSNGRGWKLTCWVGSLWRNQIRIQPFPQSCAWMFHFHPWISNLIPSWQKVTNHHYFGEFAALHAFSSSLTTVPTWKVRGYDPETFWREFRNETRVIMVVSRRSMNSQNCWNLSVSFGIRVKIINVQFYPIFRAAFEYVSGLGWIRIHFFTCLDSSWSLFFR